MSLVELLGAVGLVAGGLAAWLLLVLIACLFVRGGTQKPTPAPPARPRARLVATRERAGVVELLPTLGDAENAHTRVRRG